MMLIALWTVASQAIYSDPRGVTVEFAQLSADEISFSAKLPAGWSFVVRIDGDQNGKWGTGTGNPTSMQLTPDLAFGQDSRGGLFCSQSIFTASPIDPDQPFATSDCGVLPSKGRVELSGLDSEAKGTITIKLPIAEVFGIRSTARVQTCVWDTKRMSCQHRLSAPLVLTRR